MNVVLKNVVAGDIIYIQAMDSPLDNFGHAAVEYNGKVYLSGMGEVHIFDPGNLRFGPSLSLFHE